MSKNIFGSYSAELRKIILLSLSIIYWVYSMTEHVVFADFVTSYLNTPWGKIVPRDFSIQIGIGAVCAITIYIITRLLWGKRKIYTLIYGVFVISAMILSFRFLIFEPVEIVHFPQYAVLALLIAAALDPKREGTLIGTVLIMVTLMGIVDEVNQYFFLTREYTRYLDWNDFFLNETGASLGLILYYGFRERGEADNEFNTIVRKVNLKLILFSFSIPLLLFFVGILSISPEQEVPSGLVSENGWWRIYLQRETGYYGSWKPGDRGWLVHTLNPFIGSAIMVLYGYAISLFRFNFKEIFALKKS